MTTNTFFKKNVLFAIAALGLMFAVQGCHASSATPSLSPLTADSNTAALLKPASKDITVQGATVIKDPNFGNVWRFGDKSNRIQIADGGKFDFSKGMTIEMWIKIRRSDGQKLTFKGARRLITKTGSFRYALSKRATRFKIHCHVMSFGNLPVVATTNKVQRKTYWKGTSFYGFNPIPLNQWAHVAVTYDPDLKVARIWIDGKVVAKNYRNGDGPRPLLSNPARPLSFFEGMKDFDVASIRVSDINRVVGHLNPFTAYFDALPYRNKTAVILKHIEPSQLPVNVTISSNARVLKKFTLSVQNSQQKAIVFAPPIEKGHYPLTITATSKGKEVYSKSNYVYAGDHTKDPVHIDKDNRLIINGKPIFPLIAYHVIPEDIPQVAKIGFNILTPYHLHSTGQGGTDQKIATMRSYLDKAKASGVYVSVGSGIFRTSSWWRSLNYRGLSILAAHPATAILSGGDEPGLDKLLQLRRGYMGIRPAVQRPIWIMQNVSLYGAATAEAADIVGADPYPIPLVALRAVADDTKARIAASAGLKPVYIALDQYGAKRPSETELRAMAYLAITSGANGLGIYAWDDRNSKGKGWYTPAHPEDLKILKSVMREIVKLEPILIIPNSSRKQVLSPKNPAIHVAYKEGKKNDYLLVVNDNRKPESTTLSIAGIQSADGVDMIGRHGKTQIRNGKVLLQLQALEARVYKLTNVRKAGE